MHSIATICIGVQNGNLEREEEAVEGHEVEPQARIDNLTDYVVHSEQVVHARSVLNVHKLRLTVKSWRLFSTLIACLFRFQSQPVTREVSVGIF